jgi:hypothetical protein
MKIPLDIFLMLGFHVLWGFMEVAWKAEAVEEFRVWAS